MARLPTKSPFVLLALGLWIFACSASSAEDDDPNALNQQVKQLIEEGRYPEAVPLAEKAVELAKRVYGPEHPYTATSLNNLGELRQAMGEYPKAEPLLQEALRIRQKVLGPEHPDTALSLNNLGGLYRVMGQYDKAESLFQEALRIRQKVLGPEHLDTAISFNSLGELYGAMGEYPKAEPLLQEALRIRQKVLGPEHPDTANSLNNLAELYHDMGQYAKAEPLLKEALRIRQKVLGGEHPLTAISLDNLAALYRAMGEYDKAEPLYQEALQIERKVLGSEHPYTAQSLSNLGGLYQVMGKYDKAEPMDQEALRIRQKILGLEHPDTAQSLNNLAVLYQVMGEYVKAGPLYQEAVRIRQKVLGPEHPYTALSIANLALTKDKQFLAQTYDVQYVANGRDLLRELKPSTAKDVVLFANPDFGLASTPMLAKADNRSSDPDSKSIRGSEKREIEDWRFESLTGTQKERDELIKKFAGWGWTLIDFTAKKATKEALLKIHSPYILHLATHGFFAKEDPTTTQTEPGALLNDRQSVTKSKFFKNPMHRSGLALAGAQTTIEAWKRDEVPPVANDGILTAEDVSTLDLQGTWLVTLSACDTGSGEARAGEGVMGLPEALFKLARRTCL